MDISQREKWGHEKILVEEKSDDTGERGENFWVLPLPLGGPILGGNGITSEEVSLC